MSKRHSILKQLVTSRLKSWFPRNDMMNKDPLHMQVKRTCETGPNHGEFETKDGPRIVLSKLTWCISYHHEKTMAALGNVWPYFRFFLVAEGGHVLPKLFRERSILFRYTMVNPSSQLGLKHPNWAVALDRSCRSVSSASFISWHANREHVGVQNMGILNDLEQKCIRFRGYPITRHCG